MAFFSSGLDTPFKKVLQAYPLQGRPGASEYGGHIILPDNILQELIQREIQYPMLFKLQVETTKRSVYCGVTEFTAKPNTVYLPQWMMTQLDIKPGQDVQLLNVMLQLGTYLLIRPHTYKFVQTYPDPKSILESHVTKYPTLTQGSTIQICHEGQVWYFDIVATKPSRAVCIIDTDLRLEFDEPLDIAEYESQQRERLEQRKIRDQFLQTASNFQEQQLTSPSSPAIEHKSPNYRADTPLGYDRGENDPIGVGADNGVSVFGADSDDDEKQPKFSSEKFGAGHSIKRNAPTTTTTTTKSTTFPTSKTTTTTTKPSANTGVVFADSTSSTANHDENGLDANGNVVNQELYKRRRAELIRQQRAQMYAGSASQRATTAAAKPVLKASTNDTTFAQSTTTNNDNNNTEESGYRTVQEGNWLLYYDDKNKLIKREEFKKSFAMSGVGNSIKRDNH